MPKHSGVAWFNFTLRDIHAIRRDVTTCHSGIYQILYGVTVLVRLDRAMIITGVHFLSLKSISCFHGFRSITREEMPG